MKREILIKGGTGEAFEVSEGDLIKVVDVEGKQVADFIAICKDNTQEYLSTAHTRMMNGQTYLKKGQKLFSNYRNVLLEFVEDTVGVHDTLYPACDPARYKLDFNVDEHRNCRENFLEALKDYQIEYWRIPDPVNLFQNTPINSDGTFATHKEPETKGGDYVVFRAVTDLIVGISACPMDLTPVNGGKITDILASVERR